MIHLLSVAKSYIGSGGAPMVVFRPTSVSIPADRRVAVLGERGTGKTVLLRLLAKIEAPDQGEVIQAVRLSPVIGVTGLFHPQLTGLENIRFVARVFDIDADRLTLAVDAFCGAGGRLGEAVRLQEPADRRAMEAAVVAILPFDCYLIDNTGMLGSEILERCFEAASRREAGVIFATSNPRLVRQFANFVVAIGDATLHLFADVESAIGFHERQ
jgi:capsular polysaccharide transport system ATP-binding protein